MMNRAILILIGVWGAGTASASEFCLLDEGVRFSCTVNGGSKAVEVCDMLEVDMPLASYAYFTPGALEADLYIETDMAGIIATPWNGMGNTVFGAAKFFSEDGAYGYEVWYAGDREAGEEVEGGVIVTKGNEEIATLDCDPGSVMSDLGTLFDAIDMAQVSP